MTVGPQPLKRTPLYQAHCELNARLVDFAGWEMPVEYSGLVEEHLAVRRAAGLFDVSHMGEFLLEGDGALALLQWVTPNDVSRLSIGQAQYSALTTEGGCFVDDLLLYRLAESRYLMIVNAANIDKDFEAIRSHRRGKVEIRDASEEYALLALQGPRAADILSPLTECDLETIRYYWFLEAEVAGEPTVVSRTGYTGEDGFELLVASRHGKTLWQELLHAGQRQGLKPVGLGARDTLRLEARMALYGNDIDEQHTVLEADLGWIVKFDKGDFVGRDALLRQKQEGVPRKLVGFEMVDRGIPRRGYPVFVDGTESEAVTSGTFAPHLRKSIGLAYLPASAARMGKEFEVGIRGRRARARVVPTPFYKRPKRGPARGRRE
ncbi:MAG: glycine cleavage system aminomethyltransferase GcvT [Acidobacteriota bacterium]